MFVNAKFDQAIKCKALYSKSLYMREYEMLHEFSASKYENVELEYSNTKQATYAKNIMSKYIKNNKMSLKAFQRKNFVYVCRFETSDVCKQALAQYEVDNDTVLSFIEECTERQPIDTIGNGLRTSDVHRIYSAWCAENKEKALGRTLFYARLSELGYGEKRKSNGYEYYTAFKVKQSIINEYYTKSEVNKA